MGDHEKASLVLEIAGERVSRERFLKAATAFYRLLDEVAAEMVGSEKPIEWEAFADSGSVRLGAASLKSSAPFHSNQVLEVVHEGLSMLGASAGSGTVERPRYFNDKALVAANEISKSANLEEDQAQLYLRVHGEDRAAGLRDVAKRVDEILMPSVTDFGSVEGAVVDVNWSKRRVLNMKVEDLVTRRRIRCVLDEDMLDMAVNLLKKTERVLVRGELKYGKSGELRLVRARKLHPLPEDASVSHKDVEGILGRVRNG